MNKTPGIAQIFETASKIKSKDEKIAFLRQNFSTTMADVIKLAYHPAAVFLLPEGAPPYAPCDVEDQEHMLYREIRKMGYFLVGGGDHIKPMQREKIFIDMLQKLAPKDAELVIAMKDKKLPYGMTYELMYEAFPDLLPAPLPKE